MRGCFNPRQSTPSPMDIDNLVDIRAELDEVKQVAILKFQAITFDGRKEASDKEDPFGGFGGWLHRRPIPVQHEVVGAEYAFLNSSVKEDFVVYDILRVHLNRNLPTMIPRSADGLAHSIDDALGSDTEWREIRVYALVRRVIAKVTTQLVFGDILAGDEELVEHLSRFSASVIPSAIALPVSPSFLQPYTSCLTSIFNHIYMKKALKVLDPYIVRRIIAIESGVLKNLPIEDVLTWHILESLSKQEPRDEMVDVIACRAFATVFAALESTTLTMTCALFNVCASNPTSQIWQALEEEAMHVPWANAKQEKINDLYHADGVIKETLRHDTAIKALSGQVMQPDGLTLPDCLIHLPQGARLLMSPMHDAQVAGPSLREAYAKVGRAIRTTAHCLRNEVGTLIAPLMRGGELMAIGTNEVFPQAMFMHASRPQDIKPHGLNDPPAEMLMCHDYKELTTVMPVDLSSTMGRVSSSSSCTSVS
ncbi:hypothetical protein FBEOM_724 [Fusarium beomiforme]|uniref:Cytochrome P450 n=1 Tax=Fusarium beomiforme TaxID=44412 RepID=A0A9P5AUR6_9HYPO|nr:hypothetical protein FBEOM_724 [Fusarium beomiforme]